MKKSFLLAIVALILVASAEPALAYVLLSPRRRWASTPVSVRTYSVENGSVAGGGSVSDVVNAIRAWSVVSSSSTSSPAVRGSAPATIMLNSNGGICTGNCLAATLTGYYTTQSGDDRIYDADVYTNTAHNFTTGRSGDPCSGTEFYLTGVMVHEVGHVIGIGHSTVAGATMYPSVSACNNGPATLASDDTAAMNDLY